MGFGTVSPGVWVAPGTAHDEAAEPSIGRAWTAYVDLFRGAYLGFGSLRDRVREWWDLPAIEAQYAEFVAGTRGAAARWKALRIAAARRVRDLRRRCSPTGAGCPTSTPACRSSCCRPGWQPAAGRRRTLFAEPPGPSR